MGKAVVATPAGVAPDVVDEHRTGRLVPLADSAAMAAAVLEYRDDALVERHGAAAYRLMASHFSVDAMVDNIQRVYGASAGGVSREQALVLSE